MTSTTTNTEQADGGASLRALELEDANMLQSQVRSDTDVMARAAYSGKFSPASCVATTTIVSLLGLACVYSLTPSPAAACLGGWPQFDDADQLRARAEWATYLSSIYGSLDGFEYPLCIGDLWMLYTRDLPDDVPGPPSRCPSEDGADGLHYEVNSGLSPNHTTWSWHPRPEGFAALANGSWVEVLHRGGLTDEHVGAWFLRARGSGIWLSVGASIAFDDHDDAYEFFGLLHQGKTCEKGACNEALCARAAAAGYDTLQFVRHTCKMMYGACLDRSKRNLNYFNHEIVATGLQGIFACASANGSTPLLQTGWPQAGSGAPCTCVNNASDQLHCAEVPSSLSHA